MTADQKARIENLELLAGLGLKGRGLPPLTYEEALLYIRILEWKVRPVNERYSGA